MHVHAAGSGPQPVDALSRQPAPAGSPAPRPAAAGLPADSIATLLEALARPQIRELIDSIDARRFPADATALDSLMQSAASAVVRNDVAPALEAIAEYIKRNPENASALLSSPALQPIQTEIRELLDRITQDARTEAERQIAGAHAAVSHAPRHAANPDASTILIVAEQLVESRQLSNYFRAAELAGAVMAFYPELAGVGRSAQNAQAGRRRERASRSRLQWLPVLWRRVPMLVLLLAWLATGLAVGGAVLLAHLGGFELLSPVSVQFCGEIWAVGFLALVVFQFLASVRGAR